MTKKMIMQMIKDMMVMGFLMIMNQFQTMEKEFHMIMNLFQLMEKGFHMNMNSF